MFQKQIHSCAVETNLKIIAAVPMTKISNLRAKGTETCRRTLHPKVMKVEKTLKEQKIAETEGNAGNKSQRRRIEFLLD